MPAATDSTDAVEIELARVLKSIAVTARTLRGHGVAPMILEVYRHFARSGRGDVPADQPLADLLGVHRQSVRRARERLEERGLIRRLADRLEVDEGHHGDVIDPAQIAAVLRRGHSPPDRPVATSTTPANPASPAKPVASPRPDQGPYGPVAESAPRDPATVADAEVEAKLAECHEAIWDQVSFGRELVRRQIAGMSYEEALEGLKPSMLFFQHRDPKLKKSVDLHKFTPQQWAGYATVMVNYLREELEMPCRMCPSVGRLIKETSRRLDDGAEEQWTPQRMQEHFFTFCDPDFFRALRQRTKWMKSPIAPDEASFFNSVVITEVGRALDEGLDAYVANTEWDDDDWW